MASIKIFDLYHKKSNLCESTSGLPVDFKSNTTELWEELNEEQLETVVGGTIDSGGSSGRGRSSYRLECYRYRVAQAPGGVHRVCRRVYTRIGPV
jgi:hypothetical protein